jgi:UDP-N-acetylmuramyl tripeptide synthase
VGVTGTNGKSSTVDFLRQIWAHGGKRAASLGTLGAPSGPNGGVIDLGHTTADPAWRCTATLTTLLAEQAASRMRRWKCLEPRPRASIASAGVEPSPPARSRT